jgi:hypothetical protein
MVDDSSAFLKVRGFDFGPRIEVGRLEVCIVRGISVTDTSGELARILPLSERI